MGGKVKKPVITAAAVSLTVFFAVLSLSLYFEIGRIEEVKKGLTAIDNLWNDARLLLEFSDNPDCEALIKENFALGDRIYAEGLRVEKYEKANILTTTLFLERKRYTLLDLQFWKNSVKIREMCNASYSTVIFFYSYFNRTVEQRVFDSVMWEVKQRCGPKIIYITLPADLRISTVNLIMKKYNVTGVPAVLVNESILIEKPLPVSEFTRLLGC